MNSAARRTLAARAESWPIAGSFTISRGSKTSADVVVAEITSEGRTGRGECVPYARYNETTNSVIDQINQQSNAISAGIGHPDLCEVMPAGAARNAIDCALIDLGSKLSGDPAWKMLGLPEPTALETAYTISLGTPAEMAANAEKASTRPLLKIKLGGDGDDERIAAVRKAAPNCRLIVDANEAWTQDNFSSLIGACADVGVELIEQPLPADADAALKTLDRPVPVCADESIHGLESLGAVIGKYDAINIKLDKTGGLTEGLLLAKAAEKEGLQIMVGCMLATSLAMAPACLLAQSAHYVDLDGPLLLSKDRDSGLEFQGSTILPPKPDLWG